MGLGGVSGCDKFALIHGLNDNVILVPRTGELYSFPKGRYKLWGREPRRNLHR
ncbi:hypothetical protein A2U01_0067918, partial [Trifolium medium]|nr:hypothetical protein [Trifolium medium]